MNENAAEQDATRPTLAPSHASNRVAAIDWLRGFVIALMAIDHASLAWNGGRVAADSAYLLNPETGGPLWVPGTPLDTVQFYTRWITHLCAPTFVFLSGTSLAMSLEKRRAVGTSEGALDKHLFVRGLVLFACEAVISLLTGVGTPFLQVLFAIGASMIAMIALRRLPTNLLVALGLAWLAGSEFVLMRFFPIEETDRSVFELAFFTTGSRGALLSFYPMTHWLAMMLLGWAFGRFLLARPANESGKQDTEKLLLLSGLSALLFWAYIRSANAYGNMGLLRDDTTIVQWLHMSKYPPALVFSLMELGLMALLLVVFLRHERRMTGPPRPNNPLLVFGQTSLFFYMAHFIMLGVSAVVLTGGVQLRGLTETWIAAAIVTGVLYPVCLWYRSLKRKYPTSLLQYF